MQEMRRPNDIIIGLVALAIILIGFIIVKLAVVKLFYGGDNRCIFAECRINK